MKETTRTSRTAGYLEKIFRALNAEFFPGEEVAEPVITIQNTPQAYGHVTVAKTWSTKDQQRHELNIGAGTLDRPIENVCATMLHEMVHLYNLEHGVQDCSRGGTYHNKRFRDEAERRGLVIGYVERYGWTVTSPGERLLDFILERGWTDIDMNRGMSGSRGTTGTGAAQGGAPAAGPDPAKKKSSTRKLQCPKCGCSVRATKAVRIMCMDCMEQMAEV